MLPITRHRTLAIPHKLALTAAAVCLVLSFTVDQTSVEERLQARKSAAVQIEENEDSLPAQLAPTERASVTTARSGRGRLNLLPWFSGLAR